MSTPRGSVSINVFMCDGARNRKRKQWSVKVLSDGIFKACS